MTRDEKELVVESLENLTKIVKTQLSNIDQIVEILTKLDKRVSKLEAKP